MNPKNHRVNNIFSRNPDSKPLFLPKINIKTQAAQIINIMQSLNIFIRISGPIPEVKKICIDQ